MAKKTEREWSINSALRAIDLKNYVSFEETPVPSENTILREVRFKRALESLSDSAKEVIRIIFETPKEFEEMILSSPEKTITLAKIKEYLIEHLGWSFYGAQRSINEIRNLLRSNKW